MAEQILDLIGKPRRLIRYVEDRPGHDRRYALDASKIRKELGWEPVVSLSRGLSATIAWYRDRVIGGRGSSGVSTELIITIGTGSAWKRVREGVS